ncbi:MAG: hypothetical protein AB1942_14220 [Pseudomonadota bacterium]
MTTPDLWALSVEALPFGWVVRTGQVDGDMLFHTGAAAEAAARRLAVRLARTGVPAKLTVRLRDGSVAGRFIVPPPVPPDASPQWLDAA